MFSFLFHSFLQLLYFSVPFISFQFGKKVYVLLFFFISLQFHSFLSFNESTVRNTTFYSILFLFLKNKNLETQQPFYFLPHEIFIIIKFWADNAITKTIQMSTKGVRKVVINHGKPLTENPPSAAIVWPVM